MTCLAGGRETQLLVVRHSVLVLNLVAGVAVGRQSLKLAGCQTLVARVALDRCVRSDQRKTVLVLLNGVEGHFPALHGVALLAGCTKLPPVNVGMAIGATRTDVAENQTRVTLHAAQVGVPTPQWVMRLVVVELGKAANGTPRGERMTVLARHIEVSMRATYLGARRLLFLATGYRRQQGKQQ